MLGLVKQFFLEVHIMAVSVQDILTKVSAINDEVQAIRDSIKANPLASQAQLKQISDTVDVAKSTVDFLKADLGV